MYRNEDEHKNDEKLENLGCINCQNAIYGYSKEELEEVERLKI